MKDFLKTQIDWRKFINGELMFLVFLVFSYWVGNSKFPEHIWAIPVLMIGGGAMVLFQAYLNFKIKKEMDERNEKNN